MPSFRYIFALLILLAATACAGRNPTVVWDVQFDFGGQRTYDWAPKDPESGLEISYDVVDGAVKRSVEAHLAREGFSKSSDNPAFLLTYWVGPEEVTQISDASYYGPGWGLYWAYGWYGSNGVNVSQYELGSVTIDVLSTDPSIGLVWRGIAAARLDEQTSAGGIEGAINGAVQEILKDFPPGDGS